MGENAKRSLKKLMSQQGYPEKVADAVWKMYTPKEKKKRPQILEK